MYAFYLMYHELVSVTNRVERKEDQVGVRSVKTRDDSLASGCFQERRLVFNSASSANDQLNCERSFRTVLKTPFHSLVCPGFLPFCVCRSSFVSTRCFRVGIKRTETNLDVDGLVKGVHYSVRGVVSI